MARTYGNQGDTFGVADYAYFNKKFLQNFVQKTTFDRRATIRRILPKNESKKIEFRRWLEMKYLMFADNVNEKFFADGVMQPDVDGKQLQLTLPRGAYNQFILPEGSSGTSKANMKKYKVETEVFPIGDWDTFTEEVQIFDSKWTVAEELRQMSEVSSLVVDSFYRDLYSDGAALDYDITGAGAGHDSVADDDFTVANKKIASNLYLTGARSTGRLISASMEYGTIPVYLDYIADAHPNMIEAIADSNPDWEPVEKYAPNASDRLQDEVGKIGRIRYIRNANAYIEATETAGEYLGEVLIYGEDHTAQIPLRGKEAIETIVHPRGKSGNNDQLNRVGTLGWKAWLGAMVVYPERLGRIYAKFKW